MNRVMHRRLLQLVLLWVAPAFALHAQTAEISMTPTTVWIPAISFVGLPGEDFAAGFESAANEYRISVGNANPAVDWRITVRRQDTTWHTGLTVEARRTGDGGGPGTVTGGTIGVYQTIGTTDAMLMEGRRNKNNIPIQLRAGGAFASAGVPAGSYVTTVIYTISDR